MKQLWKIRLAAILSLEALGEADSLKLSLYGLWIGLGLIIALVCTLLETVSDC